MKRKVRVAQFGCGKMGKYLMKYTMESGGHLIGAFDRNPNAVGKDVGELIGGEKTGVSVTDASSFESFLISEKPDCVVVATRSLIREVKDVLMTCAKHGINAVTTCDEALYPWNSSPVLTKEIHDMALEHGCTITSSGFPDLSYCHLVAASAGAAHNITKITGSAMYNVEDYGIALAEHHGAGFSPERFEDEIASFDRITPQERAEIIEEGTFKPVPMWNTNGWLCARLGLTVKSQIQVCTPLFSDEPLQSKTLGRVIPPGQVIGMSAAARTETEEGIIIETESIGKVYKAGEEDTNEWVIYGEPDIYVSNKNIKNTEMICADMVSRIVDAVNGPAGFVTTDNFAPPRYLAKPLNEYIL